MVWTLHVQFRFLAGLDRHVLDMRGIFIRIRRDKHGFALAQFNAVSDKTVDIVILDLFQLCQLFFGHVLLE